MEFTDSIAGNLELLTYIISDLPPNTRGEAKRAAMAIEKVVDGLRRDNQGNPGAAVGTAFAIYTYAKRLTESRQGGDAGAGLIQLLS